VLVAGGGRVKPSTKFVEPVPKICNDCPFRRKSAPGWLGNSSPEGFIDCIQRDEPLPCHQTIDYDDPHWLAKWMRQRDTGRMCAGALTLMANKLQRAHTPGFPTMPRDVENVFSNSVEFVRHHREAAVHSWDDDDQNDGAQLQRMLIERAAEVMGQPIEDFNNKKRRKV
jgi:hypothetical protein